MFVLQNQRAFWVVSMLFIGTEIVAPEWLTNCEPDCSNSRIVGPRQQFDDSLAALLTPEAQTDALDQFEEHDEPVHIPAPLSQGSSASARRQSASTARSQSSASVVPLRNAPKQGPPRIFATRIRMVL